MAKNFLTVEQVEELALLGVTFEDSEFIWLVEYHLNKIGNLKTIHRRKSKDHYPFSEMEKDNVKHYPAPTLSEVLEKIPKVITIGEHNHNTHEFDLGLDKDEYEVGYYSQDPETDFLTYNKSLIDAVFNVLKWLATNHPEQLKQGGNK